MTIEKPENQHIIDLLDNGYVCFSIVNEDPINLRITQINQFAIKVLGLSEKDIYNISFKDLAPECYESIHYNFNILLQSKTTIRFITTVFSKNITLSIKATYTNRNEITCIFYDISEQLNYEQRLQEQNEEIQTQNEELAATNEELIQSSENLFETNNILAKNEQELKQINGMIQSVLNHIPAAVFWKNTESIYLGCNIVFARDAGYNDPSDIIGKTDADFFSKSDVELYYADDKEVISKGIRKLNYEEPQQKSDGSISTLRTNKVPLLNHKNEIIGIIGTYEDITDIKNIQIELIKAKEKAEESDRLKSAFLANMSHEIRTPMNGIIGFSQLLKEKEITDEEKVSYIDIINESGIQLLSIVNDIIDISKIEAGLVELRIKDINVTDLINSSYSFYLKVAEQNNISLTLNNKVPKEFSFAQDEIKIQQILGNLISNAIKFTQKGGVTINCRLVRGMLYIEIKDTGLGISEEFKKSIFQRFRQGRYRPESNRGTGLGLSICKGYIDKMNGFIGFDSELGKGSTFYISLPSLA